MENKEKKTTNNKETETKKEKELAKALSKELEESLGLSLELAMLRLKYAKLQRKKVKDEQCAFECGCMFGLTLAAGFAVGTFLFKEFIHI